MLSKKGFDEWVKTYEQDVFDSDEAGEFPFAGYRDVLFTIYQTGLKRMPKRVLDVGIGTGVLAKQFYDAGAAVDGMDFSQKMLDVSKQRMPEARLEVQDMREGLPPAFQETSYDLIISTYALHHLHYQEKVHAIKTLQNQLANDGVLLIGDVAFETFDEHERVRRNQRGYWDEDEHYWVYETLQKDFPKSLFVPISFCAGVLIVRRK